MVGSPETRLIIIRGNSASGKTTLARTLREHVGSGLAIVGQDQLRREILRVKDTPDNASIGLIDTVARYALDQGMTVVVEGILKADRYGAMLRQLVADHEGISRAYWFDLHFDETLARHRNKPGVDYDESMLQQWWNGTDLVDGLDEALLVSEDDYEANAQRILHDTGLSVFDHDDDYPEPEDS